VTKCNLMTGGRYVDISGRRVLGARDFEWAYARVKTLTPLKADCGELCSKACCHGLEANAGMYLFPGEEAMYGPEDEQWLRVEWHAVAERDFCPSWERQIERVAFVVCDAVCPRDKRPLACRLFPVAAVPQVSLLPDGLHLVKMDVDLDSDAQLMCPLARHASIDQLDPEFVEACRDVYTHLAMDPLLLADFVWQAESRARDASAPWSKLLK